MDAFPHAEPVASPSPVLPHHGVRIDDWSRLALAELGAALRQDGALAEGGWAATMARGGAIGRVELEQRLPQGTVDDLLDAGLAARWGDDVVLATTVASFGGVLTAIPKTGWGDEVVYVGEDSPHLIEAVLRLAPHGDRAAELGTGTGVLAVLLAARYRRVVGTDLAASVVLAAGLTLALNPVPEGHAVAVCRADVADGLPLGAFDLVAANAPWVPLAIDADAPRELFAHGGESGVELPGRFLVEGAARLRAGGVAITLALDVQLGDGSRPLRAITDDLASDGYVVTLLPTPFNRERPHLVERMRERQPSIADAVHVAVVVARPHGPGDDRSSLLAAAGALGRRWAAVVPTTTR